MTGASGKSAKMRPIEDPRGVKDRLDKALAAKEVVAIRYHGGSTPGGYREILPLRVTLTGKLQALDMVTRAVKLFVFANVELTDLRTPLDAHPADTARQIGVPPGDDPRSE